MAKNLYACFVTPPSGVGGEFPMPARVGSRKTVLAYAAACREKLGQKTRVVPWSHAKEKARREMIARTMERQRAEFD